MAKKTFIEQDFEDDEYEVISKKSKRRMAKAASRAQQQQQQQLLQQQQQPKEPEIAEEDDTMSRMAVLCQEERWREALILCRRSLEKAVAESQEDLELTLRMALPKIEYSWRRHCAAVLIEGSKAMLQKEYLLNVGE